MNYAGIDVSYKEFVIVVSVKGKTHKAKTFENTASGHNAIIQLLSKLKGGSRVCMEATGVYHFDLALALSRAEDMDVMVINPKALHNFVKVLMKCSKPMRLMQKYWRFIAKQCLLKRGNAQWIKPLPSERWLEELPP